MIKILFISICLLVGCSTITPDRVTSRYPSPDSSTQSVYSGTSFNSGFLGYAQNKGIITPDARTAYNLLIDKYRLQFSDEYAVLLTRDYGVEPYEGEGGDMLFLINKQALSYFCRLVQWSRDKRDGDTMWLKLKSMIVK